MKKDCSQVIYTMGIESDLWMSGTLPEKEVLDFIHRAAQNLPYTEEDLLKVLGDLSQACIQEKWNGRQPVHIQPSDIIVCGGHYRLRKYLRYEVLDINTMPGVIYSLGETMLQLATLRPHMRYCGQKQVDEDMKRRKYSQRFIELIKWMRKKEPGNRPCIEEVRLAVISKFSHRFERDEEGNYRLPHSTQYRITASGDVSPELVQLLYTGQYIEVECLALKFLSSRSYTDFPHLRLLFARLYFLFGKYCEIIDLLGNFVTHQIEASEKEEELGNLCSGLCMLSSAYLHVGSQEEAVAWLLRMLRKQVGCQITQRLLVQLCMVYHVSGEIQKCEEILNSSLLRSAEIRDIEALSLLGWMRKDTIACRSAVVKCIRTYGGQDYYTAEASRLLGDVHAQEKQFDLAKTELDRALSIAKDVLGPESVLFLQVHSALNANHLKSEVIRTAPHDLYLTILMLEKCKITQLTSTENGDKCGWEQTCNWADTGLDKGKLAEQCCWAALRLLAASPVRPRDKAEVYQCVGNVYRQLRKWKTALFYQKLSLEILKKVIDEKHPEIARAYDEISGLYLLLGKYEKGVIFQSKSLEIGEEILLPTHFDLAVSYNTLSMLYLKQQKWTESLAYQFKSMRIKEEIYGENHLVVALAYNNMSVIYGSMGKYPLALDYAKKSLRIRQAKLSPKHPDLALTLNNIAEICREQGKYSEAEHTLQHCIKIREEVLDPWHPHLAVSYHNLAAIYKDVGKYPLARNYHQKCIEIYAKAVPDTHPDLLDVYQSMACTLENIKEFRKSAECLLKCINICKNDLKLAALYENLARMYEYLSEYNEAVRFQLKCISIREEKMSPAPLLATSYENIARIYAESGQPGQASLWKGKCTAILVTLNRVT